MGTTWTWEFPIAETGKERDKQLELERQHGMRTGLQCRSMSKQTGKQCGQPAKPWGAGTCHYHGGNSVQAMRKAEERRRAAYELWNETPESERYLHFPAWPVREVDFTREALPEKQKSPTAKRKAVRDKKARLIAQWPEREPEPQAWPPADTSALLYGQPPAERPALARVLREY